MLAPGRRLSLLVVVVCLLGLASCSGKAPPPPKHDIQIRELWHVYFEYMVKTFKQEGASNAEELNAWATKNMPSDRLKKMAVYDLAAAFVSPRDNLPYIVRSFNKSKKDGGVVIHETTGLNGKRFVAYGTGEVAELTEEEFQQALR
jgi:hypothetical protein